MARRLRLEEKFSGYIHLKTIPESSAELVEQAGLYADRLSINVELPTDEGVKRLAPEKRPETIRLSMARLRQKMEEKAEPTLRTKKRERFAPGGQSTQMIVGADRTSDDGILHTSARAPPRAMRLIKTVPKRCGAPISRTSSIRHGSR